MKFSIYTILFLFALILPGVGQEELLPDGAYGTTIHGGIKAGEKKHYTLVGQEGQVFKANLSTRGVEQGATLDLIDSAGASVLGSITKITKVDALNLVLPKRDKYRLFVKAGQAKCSYVLEVTLEDGESIPKSPSKPDSSPSERESRPLEDDL